MTSKQIIQLFKDLARSQGFYGRLLAQLQDIRSNDPEKFEEIMQAFSKYDNPVDLIMAIEG
jgi:hypothetical protein